MYMCIYAYLLCGYTTILSHPSFSISRNVNVQVRLQFELVYFEAGDQHFRYYTTGVLYKEYLISHKSQQKKKMM